jgi:hypothetical protein
MINASVSGDEILVAAGTYTPSRKANDTGTITPDDRDNAFVLKDGINIYGGFPGDASTNDDRDWKANTTTLSGDFDGDDDGFNNMSENAHHVVIDIALSANTILDGFTITGGNAETNAFISCNGQNIPKDHGGGIFSSRSSLTLTNVIITGNMATGGGGMFNQYSSPTLINVIIRGNTANGSGGGMYNQSSSFPKLVNVTIAGNAAADGGGMFNTGSSAPQLYNSILWDNQAVNGRSVGNDDGSPSYFYCLIQDRNDDSDGCIDALSVDGDVFVDADAGDYRLRDGCRAIDAGSDAHYQTAVDAIAVKIPGYDGFLDLDGNVRKAGEAIDPGAYEYGSVPPDVTPPVLSEGTISRTSDTEATVSFTTDEAGTAYYLVLDSDGNAPAKEAVKTDGHSLGAVEEGEANDKEVALTAGAKDIYVVVEDAAGNISDPLKIEAPAYDLTPPALSEGTAGRTGETEATVGFITDEAGTAYRFIVNGGSYAPSKEAVKEFGIFLCAVEEGAVSDTVILEGAGAKDIYVVVEDAAGNMSEALKIAVPAFIDPTPPALSAGTFSRTSETNATIGFTTSKAGTAYGFAVSGGSYAPSKEAVKEFGISLGAVATGAVSDIAVMLTAGAKDIYVVLEDAADNISNPLKIAVPAYSDVTAPILSATGASDTTQTGVTLNFTTGEAGTFYYLVYAEAGAAPTADVIKAQGAAIAKGTGMTAPAGTNTAVTVGGLTAATAYRAYVIVEDAAGNLSAVATIAFTTLAAPDRHIELSLLEDGLTVHIRNTGSVETGNLTLALSGANADVFTFSSATINSISVDGAVDITLTLRAGLPVETYTVTLTVSGEGFTPVSKEITCTPTGNDHLQSNPLKARMRSATLHVSGLTAGRMWSVYSISGMLLHHNIAGSDEADVVLPARGIYIVTSGGESIKTIY